MADREPHYRTIGGDTERPSRPRAFFFPGLNTVSSDMAREYLDRVRFFFTIYGAAFLLVGILAIVIPIVFTGISVQQMVAWILLIAGVTSLVHFVLIFGAPGTTSYLLLGILHLAVGLWLLLQARVRRGTAFVWLMFGWFVLHGLVKLLMGYELRSLKSWPSLAASAAVSVILAILNIALVRVYGLYLLGVLFGINLAVTGIAFLLISTMAHLAARSSNQDPLLENRA